MGNDNFKIWMAQIRANFLILAALLVTIGLALSYKYQPSGTQFNIAYAILLVIGVVSAHISVNLFNEYSDYHTKIDFNTTRTPFSGGSGMLTGGKTKPSSVRFAALLTLFIAAAIGIYFAFVAHWSILVVSIVGAFAILFYTKFLAKVLMGEFFAGLALGTLVVLGTYIAMTATPASSLSVLLPSEVIWVSIPPGILTSLLLLINEFPDTEADKKGGRKHLVIKFGQKNAAYIYTLGMVATFGIIIFLPISGISSAWILLALLPLPLAVQASSIAIQHGNDLDKLVPALGSNVITVLATDLLLAVSILIAVI
ncbi:prenyltransferase [candidate division KSB1 bacterium]